MHSLSKGQQIAGRYVVETRIGGGAYGDVYLVIDRELANRPIALKLLSQESSSKKSSYARFVNEVTQTRELSHPNIIRVYDIGRHGEASVFLTMEYIDGRDLATIVAESQEQFGLEDAIWIIAQIANGLEYAHGRGVIHRDLKPDNVLLSSEGQVKLTDFGLARWTEVTERVTKQWQIVGTPLYMAPEQFKGPDVDARADIYSLGLLAFEIVTGSRAYAPRDYDELVDCHLRRSVPNLREYRSDVPLWLAELISKCVEKRPEDRFQSCRDITKYLKQNHAEKLLESDSNVSLRKRVTEVCQKPSERLEIEKKLQLKPRQIPQHYVEFPPLDEEGESSTLVKILAAIFIISTLMIVLMNQANIDFRLDSSSSPVTAKLPVEASHQIEFTGVNTKLIWPDGTEPLGSVPSYKVKSLRLHSVIEGLSRRGQPISLAKAKKNLSVEVRLASNNSLVETYKGAQLAFSDEVSITEFSLSLSDLAMLLPRSDDYEFIVMYKDEELSRVTLEIPLVKLHSS